MVKLADIAQETGFSIYTVSCALRGRGRLSEETRTTIKEVATKLGYAGNAAASILAQQKQPLVMEGKQMSIAWIGRNSGRHSYYTGFEHGCRELGYEGSCFHPKSFPSAKAMVRVLWNRGIKGVIIDASHSKWSQEEWANANWELLSVVKISRIHPELSFHHIRHSAFDYMLFTLDRVFEQGYRKIAVLIVNSLSDLDNITRIGAVLAYQRQQKRKRTGCSVYIHEVDDLAYPFTLNKNSLNFLKKVQPDAVVAFPYLWIKGLQQAGYRIPEDLGFATPLSSYGDDATTGCDPQTMEIGRRAVFRLHTLIQTGERGMAPNFLQDVVDPAWVDAGTLPPRHVKKTEVEA